MDISDIRSLAVSAAVVLGTLCAAGAAPSVALQLTDGTEYSVSLGSSPTISLVGGTLEISSAEGRFVIPADRLVAWRYTDLASTADAELARKPSVMVEGGLVRLGIPEGRVMVYCHSTGGSLLFAGECSDGDILPVRLRRPEPVIITMGGHSFKITAL